MAPKHYYAITKNGHLALSFDSAALRDFFIEREPDRFYVKATRDQYLKVKRHSKLPNSVGTFGVHRVCDMCDPDVPEWWDGWYDIRDAARAAGLLP